MWIRSQNKEELIKCNSFVYAERNIYPNKIKCCIYGNGVFIGIYSTKEKALKVLDMIQERIARSILLKQKDMIIPIKNYGDIFQMPQDSEVE